jgi:hypothetical protein
VAANLITNLAFYILALKKVGSGAISWPVSGKNDHISIGSV